MTSARQARSIRKFTRDLEAFAEELGEDIGLITKKLAFDMHRTATDQTTIHEVVDTGRYRASWGVAPVPIPADDGAKPDPSGVAVGVQSERTFNVTPENPYTPWIVWNHVAYAVVLEEKYNIGLITVTKAEIDIDTELSIRRG